MSILLKNCQLIDELTQERRTYGDVLIKDGLIIQIADEIIAENDVKTLDLQGKFLVPGFIDLHIHLTLSGNDVLYDNFKSDYYMTMMSYKFTLDTLKAGFTTVRDVGSNMALVNSVRDAINDDLLVGPTIISSGKILSPSENGNEYFAKMYQECDGEYEAISAVRKELKDGADFIKIMASGAIMNPGGEPGSPILSDAEVKAIVDTAAIKNKYVAAHAHSSQAIKQCITYGVRTIEHASLIDEEAIAMLENNETTYIVPTITAFAGMINADTGEASFISEKLNKFMDQFLSCLKNAYQKNVFMGFGTDQGVSAAYHGLNGDEFVYRKEVIGMNDLDILLQATKHSAIIAQIDDKVGTIEVGKVADLVVLDGDPSKDISVCKNNLCNVIKNGVCVNV